MGHFARLDDSDRVIQVIAVNNAELVDGDGVEHEEIGIEFCKSIFGDDTVWVKTSFNAATNGFRGKHANLNDVYDRVNDVFVAPFDPLDIP